MTMSVFLAISFSFEDGREDGSLLLYWEEEIQPRSFGMGGCKEGSPRTGSALELSPASSSKRLRFEEVPDAAMNEMKKGYVSLNMEANTKWALNNFLEWCESRGMTLENAVDDDLLQSSDTEIHCYWLSRFAVETREDCSWRILSSS